MNWVVTSIVAIFGAVLGAFFWCAAVLAWHVMNASGVFIYSVWMQGPHMAFSLAGTMVCGACLLLAISRPGRSDR